MALIPQVTCRRCGQVTILADELRKRGLDIPKGILRKEELVEAITHLQQ